ncbi:hypothetical protein Hanom_Chr00s040582g01774291 [Helianthus anomalus]
MGLSISILNSVELDRAEVALTVASRAASHRAGYVECTTHVKIAFDTQWGTRYYLVNEQAEEGLRKAEENYDNLSLPVMDLVFEALKHGNYVARLKAIFEPSETVELTDKCKCDSCLNIVARFRAMIAGTLEA